MSEYIEQFEACDVSDLPNMCLNTYRVWTTCDDVNAIIESKMLYLTDEEFLEYKGLGVNLDFLYDNPSHDCFGNKENKVYETTYEHHALIKEAINRGEVPLDYMRYLSFQTGEEDNESVAYVGIRNDGLLVVIDKDNDNPFIVEEGYYLTYHERLKKGLFYHVPVCELLCTVEKPFCLSYTESKFNNTLSSDFYFRGNSNKLTALDILAPVSKRVVSAFNDLCASPVFFNYNNCSEFNGLMKCVNKLTKELFEFGIYRFDRRNIATNKYALILLESFNVQ